MEIDEVNAVDVYSKLSRGIDIQIVDLRSKIEYDLIKVPRSVRMPLTQFLNKPIQDCGSETYFLCRDSSDCAEVKETLAKCGIKKSHMIKGGMDAWVRNRLPVLKSYVELLKDTTNGDENESPYCN